MKKRIQTPAAVLAKRPEGACYCNLDEDKCVAAGHQVKASETARPKFCVDCSYFNPVAGRFFCAAARSLVTGVPQETDCWEMRSEVRGGECGREGRLFKRADSTAV